MIFLFHLRRCARSQMAQQKVCYEGKKSQED
jgi:hypothetical protein